MLNFSLSMLMPKWLAIVCILSLSMSCTDKYESAAEYATQSEALFASGNLVEARLNIQKAIAQRDDVAAFYILLGRIELQAEQPVSAFNAYSLALDLEADNLEVLQNIADIGLQTGRVQEAKEAASRILLLAPASTGAMLVKGFIAIDEGRFDDAQKAVDDIMAINPSDEGGVILGARIDALQGRTEAALAKIDNSIATIGQTNALNVTRLEILRVLGNPKGMASVFPAILKTMKDDADFRLDYINLLYKMGNIAAARSESKVLLSKEANSRPPLEKLTALWSQYDKAPLTETELKDIAGMSTVVTQIILARHFYTEGNFDTAARLVAGPVGNKVAEGIALQARILLAQGQSKAASDLAGKVIQADARNEDALLVRSAIHFAGKNYDRAIEDANVVVSDAPLNPMGYVALADAHFAKGAPVRARQVFEKGMSSMPQSLFLASHYKQFLVKIGDTQRIVSLARSVALASPSSTKAWKNYQSQCQLYADSNCSSKALAGLARAQRSYIIDEPPGTPKRRGLFARITPEKICATTGGICTDS